ncbi:sulfotransferase family protein [Herbidospora galbida]|uniref:Sulfotransferase family protein n=1 Tax=Herbidospora galbida TaxID=2575442 RepID=A0A4U3M8B1_9ACTN|nr:sulfotransferase family protein [Herbidospora galbida]TKK85238.1 sulfotransferase family protein [Herbidospora galbida]
MDVIGAGFGRTCTLSLKAALEILGFGPCYHMADVVEDPRKIRQWLDVGDGKTTDWDAIFRGFRSAVDFPAVSYWRELTDHYPEANVVLTVRDPDRWYESAQDTIFHRAVEPEEPGSRWRRVLHRLMLWRVPELALFPRMAEATVADRVFGGRLDDREHCIEVFRRHNEEVRATIPAGRLLVFECRQGWEPLCRFLGAPVPDVPFPHVNDRMEFNRRQPWRELRRFVLGRRRGA